MWFACFPLTIKRSMRLNQEMLVIVFFAGRAVAADSVEVTPTGRLHVDYAHHDSAVAQFDDKALVRRAEFGLRGEFGSHWSAKIVYDFARGGSFKDIYLRYRGWDRTKLTLGQFKVPFGLEQLTSDNDITFMERALPTEAFKLSRRKAIGLQSSDANYTWEAMGFGSSVEGEGGNGAAARFTFNPIKEGDILVHVGLAALTQRPKDAVNIGARQEALPTDIRLVRTGQIGTVTRMNQLGVEAAWKEGPFSIQSEWMQTRLSRRSSEPDVSFHGWYVAGNWVLSGESRGYQDGVFKSVVPVGKAGAWELAVRYSRISLNGGQIRGGKEDNVTFGLNWYFNEHLRLMADYVMVNSDRRGVSDNPNILDVRAQIAF